MIAKYEPGPWLIDPEETMKTVTISRKVQDRDGMEWWSLVAQLSILEGKSGNANLQLILAAPLLVDSIVAAAEAIRQGEPNIALLYLEKGIELATGDD